MRLRGVFLGAAQSGLVSRWVAEAAWGTVLVDGLPYWHAHTSGEDTTAFSVAYLQAAFHAVCYEFSIFRANVIAESQAAPATVLLAQSELGMVSNDSACL